MRKLQLLFLLGSLIFATGCPKYRPKVDFNRNGFVKQVNTFFVDRQTEYFKKLDENKPDEAKQIRNELIEYALPYIDEAYMDFITGLQSGRDRDNFIADLVELGASAAIGITNGERPLQIMGVALTAVRGGRRSADLNFYKEQSTPVLISKMDGNRAKVRATIITRENEEVSTYPIGAAVGDIVAYYNAGTLVRAFTELQKDTAVATEASEKALADAKKAAGIRGVVPPDALKASNDFRDAIRNHTVAYRTALTNITTAQGKISAAETEIAQAVTAISKADQAIGTATGQITSAGNNAIDKAKAEAALEKAKAARAEAEKKQLEQENAQKAAETAKAEATKSRDAALTKLQAIFEAISDNPKLAPLLSKGIEEDTSLTADGKAELRAMLDQLRQKPTPTTDNDKNTLMNAYGRVLLKFQGTIINTGDAEMITALRDILNANK